MAFDIDTSTTARVDGFVDDLINVFLDTPENCARQPFVVPLAVHATSRPHTSSDEPLPRRTILSSPKLQAAGTPDDIQLILGWLLRTRELLLSLPTDKYKAWRSDIESLISRCTTTSSELESLLGRLNHAAHIIPLARHFLNRIRNHLPGNRKRSRRQIRLSSGALADLHLWLAFLRTAHTTRKTARNSTTAPKNAPQTRSSARSRSSHH